MSWLREIFRLRGGRWAVFLTGLWVWCGVTGCATGFRSEWRAAQKVSFAEDDLAGRWAGHWMSDVNHHTGKLRCVLRRQPDGRYLARYHATYGRLFRFTYSVPLVAERSERGWIFSGSADLGGTAGGVYTYSGEADSTNFLSHYECVRDHGSFRMTRVLPPAVPH